MENPGFQEYMYPILDYLKNGDLRSKREIFEEMANRFQLTDELREEMLPSQSERTYTNRISWAVTYLKKAKLVCSPKRAHYTITQEGCSVVDNPSINYIDIRFLRQYKSFVEFQNTTDEQSIGVNIASDKTDEGTPLERILVAEKTIRQNVCDDLLSSILSHSPYKFEKIVVDLVVAMGYGGNVEDAGRATKKSGDEGIDGLVKEDKLGLEKIYIQAKRYAVDNKVGRPAISQFIGDLQLKGARKGIFITTSSFTDQAFAAAENNALASIILIDGVKLVELMYEFNIGVSVQKIIELKKIDNDYFEEE